MEGLKNDPLPPAALMNLLVAAGFTHDAKYRLLTVNEPWDGTVPAPRFLLGRTIDGNTVLRYREDIPAGLADELRRISADESPAASFEDAPKHRDEYLRLSGGGKCAMGPDFLVLPGTDKPDALLKAVGITPENIGDFSIKGFEWLPDEIGMVQPCAGLVHEGRLVSQCRSVRRTPLAHAAGLETLPEFRRRGYAAIVTRWWAAEVRKTGAIPFYSTSWNNTASQQVARKLGLYHFGNTFSTNQDEKPKTVCAGIPGELSPQSGGIFE